MFKYLSLKISSKGFLCFTFFRINHYIHYRYYTKLNGERTSKRYTDGI